jgi:hypothetical protein
MTANPLILLVRLERFELPTYGLEVRCSIQLSYRRGCKYVIRLTYERLNVHRYRSAQS